MTTNYKRIVFLTLAVVCASCWEIPCRAQDLVADIISNGEIKVGIVLGCPPFAFTDEDGSVKGFNADIAGYLADRLSVKLLITELQPDDLLANPSCDIVISNAPRTLDLANLYRFSEPYLRSGQSVILGEHSLYVKDWSELDAQGKNIAVVEGTCGKQVANKKFKKASVSIVKNEADALSMLLRGRADALVYDRQIAEYICLAHPEWKVLPGQISDDFYCILFPRGDTENKKSEEWYCIPWFNVFISELKISKQYADIFNRWFGPDRALAQ